MQRSLAPTFAQTFPHAIANLALRSRPGIASASRSATSGLAVRKMANVFPGTESKHRAERRFAFDVHIYYLKKGSNSRKKLRVRGSADIDVAMATRIDRGRASGTQAERGAPRLGEKKERKEERKRGSEKERRRKSHPHYVCTPLNNYGSFA